ncbi:carbamoyltransferase C-terminal domain-containing protein [Streptacidiphilus sp. P02-A3a]|uniref:carbamoyltransferase family protein n=1 Tax=Streptacidiphilus sp. P02-A3a TaxID=2704468 RepID=UPI0015FAE280|nr:carbamoyltransferase C-terminal domain-containing protein [Streptacidiphilus sp. P02-A3a]QMU70539.1 carbamoyltransferase [Streptacidiphilus sp. P02-A3a]
MLTIGLNGNFSPENSDIVPGLREYMYHDAAAALVRDGVLIAAVEEERVNRIKHTTKFPINAVRACLDIAGATPADIDAVGYYFPEQHLDIMLNGLYADNPGVPLRYSRELIKDRLREGLGWELPDQKLCYTSHHRAHAMSGFARSGMVEALVVVLDGMGEDGSGTVFSATGGDLEPISKFAMHKSLGLLYLNATRHLGFRFGDEYKVMGLAPYGDPGVYRAVFDSMYTLGPNGDYDFPPHAMAFEYVSNLFFAHGLPPRRASDPVEQRHQDFAAGLQEMLERIVLHVLEYWSLSTRHTRLVFSGGVAHNCSLNGAVLRSGLFGEVFVHPASHDAGTAEGAALLAQEALAGPVRLKERLRSASLGPGLGSSQSVREKLESWGRLVEYERPADIVETTAGLLAEGAVIGWAQGRSEFGPRALGNRSILADPRPAENRTRINAMIKKRESFRPFAPMVVSEAADTYFELPDTAANYDFMSFVVRVRPEHRRTLGAVTHVDGTARIQIVAPEVNERVHRLVTRFGALTGTPVLLNTSMNNSAEPIVQSVEDALTCLLTTELDCLVVDDFLVRRRPGFHGALDSLVLTLRPVTKLTRSTRATGSGENAVSHEIVLDYATGPRAAVSPELFALLERADGSRTVGALADATVGLTEQTGLELHALWQQRFFTLSPSPVPRAGHGRTR